MEAKHVRERDPPHLNLIEGAEPQLEEAAPKPICAARSILSKQTCVNQSGGKAMRGGRLEPGSSRDVG